MRQAPAPSPRRRPRRYVRAAAIVGATVVSLLIVAGAVAVQQRDTGRSSFVTVAGVSPTATTQPVPPSMPTQVPEERPTATPSPTASATASATATATATAMATETAPRAEATPAAPPTAATVAPAAATPAATPTVDSGQPVLSVRPRQVGQGETMVVSMTAPTAAAVTVEYEGSIYSLRQEGSVFWGVLGASLYAPLGPGTITAIVRAADGSTLATASQGYEVTAVDRPHEQLIVTEEVASILTPEASIRERELRAQQFAQFDLGPRWTGPFHLPFEGRTTTQFGQGRSINGGPVGGFHSGHDLAAPEGTPILAPAPGRISWVGAMPIRGNSVVIDHGGGVKSGYHHMVQTAVTVGDYVETGDYIGGVGSTGFSTGPHLHWELTVWGVNVDPMTWTRVAFVP